MYLYVLKDAVLLFAYALYLFSNRIRLPRPAWKTYLPLALGLYASVITLQTVNPRLPGLSVGLLGFRAHLFYVGLVLVVPLALTFVDRPIRLLTWFLGGIATPVLILGVYQFFQAPSSWVNRYAADESAITAIGEHPRITGTFSYITGMDTFLILSICLGVGLIYAGVHMDRKSVLLWGVIFTGLALTVAPMNGSRSTFIFIAVPLPFVLYDMMGQYGRKTSAAVAIIAVGVIVWSFAQTDLAAAWQTFIGRVRGTSDTERRALSLFLQPYRELGNVGLFGYGAGATHQAASTLVGSPHSSWLPMGAREQSWVRLLIELGPIGMVTVLGLKGYLVYFAYRTMRQSRSVFTAVIGSAAFLFLAAHIVAPVAFNHVAASFYWLLVGLVLFAWSQDEVTRTVEGVWRRRNVVLER